MTVGIPVNKSYVISRFNAIVSNGLTLPRGGATWHTGNQPMSLDGNLGRPNPLIVGNPLGPGSEGLKTVNDLPAGDLLPSVIFSALHRFAMEYTRVRSADYWRRTGSAGTSSVFAGNNIAAFRTDLALSMPIPSHPLPGQPVTTAQLDAFLNSLRNMVNTRRGSSNYRAVLMSCHSSCHSSCHGSRGRR